MPFLDRLTLGPARRRRRPERLMRDLDRWDTTLEQRPLRSTRSRRRRRRPRETVRSALVLVTTAVVMVAMVSVFTPALVPQGLVGRWGLGREPLGRAPEVGGSGSYAFLAHQPGDRSKPVAYDPCREIHVELNPQHGPRNSSRLLANALETMRAATGLRFVYDGNSDRRPSWSSPTRPLALGRQEPVLVSFATEEEVPELRGRVAGVGGSTSVRSEFGPRRYITGQVTLDADSFRTLSGDPEDGPHELAIMLHEFGHLVGLAHVSDSRELMYSENLGRTSFGHGDRIGLAALGRGQCF